MVSFLNPLRTTTISPKIITDDVTPVIALEPHGQVTAPLRMGSVESKLARLRFPAELAKETIHQKSHPHSKAEISLKEELVFDAEAYREIVDTVDVQKDTTLMNDAATKDKAHRANLVANTVAIWQAEDQRDAAAVKAAVARANANSMKEAIRCRDAATAIAAVRAAEHIRAVAARDEFYASRTARELDREAVLAIREANAARSAAKAQAALQTSVALEQRRLEIEAAEAAALQEVISFNAAADAKAAAAHAAVAAREAARKRLQSTRESLMLEDLDWQASLSRMENINEVKEAQKIERKLEKASDKLAVANLLSPTKTQILALEGPEPEPAVRAALAADQSLFRLREARQEALDIEERVGSVLQDAKRMENLSEVYLSEATGFGSPALASELDAMKRLAASEIKAKALAKESQNLASPTARLAAKYAAEDVEVARAATLAATTAAEQQILTAETLELEAAANVARRAAKRAEDRLVADAASVGLFAWRENANGPWHVTDPSAAIRSLTGGKLSSSKYYKYTA